MEITINELTKTIKGVNILNKINLSFQSGTVYGFKGVNGSGKTMLMRAICGLILPTSGEIKIDNEVLGRDISFPRSVGILIENPSFIPNYTGYENLKLLASIQERIGDDVIAEILNIVGLDANDKRKYKKYSLGMKQKLGIAAALMEKPDIIILDEPLNALDEDGVHRVKELIMEHRKRGAIIFLACHDALELEDLSDVIVHIENGQIKSVQNN